MNKMKKIRVAFIYNKSCQYMTGSFFAMGQYHFFVDSLKRNKQVEMNYFPTDEVFDVSEFKNRFDIIMLWNDYYVGMPSELIGIQNLDIPVISQIGDPHATKRFDPSFEYNRKYKIDYYFGFVPSSYFYQYYPKEFRYKTIIYGLEPSVYANIVPYNQRIKNRILNSGAVGNTKPISRIINRILNSESNALKHYRLRTICNNLPFVDYTPTLAHEYQGDKYTILLQKYAVAIAATTYYPTRKYLEIPASGCLTFMEITEKNDGLSLGFVDGETAIFIDEENYLEKFKEYIANTENPQWERIANEGRRYVLNNLNNDIAAESLIDLMRKLL
jgi:hypothetical protein